MSLLPLKLRILKFFMTAKGRIFSLLGLLLLAFAIWYFFFR